MIKNNLFVLILAFLNLVAGLLLTILCIPELVPVFSGLGEKIILLSSKWILLANAIIPAILAVLCLVFYKRKDLCFIFKFVIGLFLYENMLIYSYFSLEKTFEIGSLLKIPYAITILLPISASAIIYSSKIKHIPYKSIIGLRCKYSLETEFLWKQIHLYASDVLLKCSLLSFAISLPFIFLRLSYVGLLIVFAIISVGIVFIHKESKKLYKKYLELKEHQEKHSKLMEEYDKTIKKN